jgi:chemotaxis signal transduction protein
MASSSTRRNSTRRSGSSLSAESSRGAEGGTAGPDTALWLPLRAAGEPYAVEATRVLATLGTDRLQRNPAGHTPLGWLLGIEGDLPVFGLAGAASNPDPAQVLVLDGPPSVGLAIDSLSPATKVAVTGLRRLPSPAGGGLFRRAALAAGEIVLEVDPAAVATAVAAADYREQRGSAVRPVETPPAGDRDFALPPAPAGEVKRLLIFAAAGGGTLLGLAASQVIEIVRPAHLRSLPGAPRAVLGLIAWRGEPVAVVDVEWAVGLATPAPPPGARLLVARAVASDQVVALPVERVTAILQGPLRGRRLPLASGQSAPWVREVYEDDGRRVLLPDLDQLLGAAPPANPAAG